MVSIAPPRDPWDDELRPFAFQGDRVMQRDVLIIGAGPSGLFAASELARHGVAARLIEREIRPHQEARATAIQPGTLEILDSVGALPPFLDAAEHIRCARLYGPNMVELGAMSHDSIDCRCKFQCSLPQYETQRILEAHLTSLGGRVERGVTATKLEADGDEIDVSDQVHTSIMDVADAVRQGRAVHPAIVEPMAGALLGNARAMIDVDYTGSPLVVDHDGAGLAGPHPGQRYLDWTRFGGTSHHVLVFGAATHAASFAQLGRRWSGLVQVSHNPSVDPARAGFPAGGVVMIRPDGHIGFRHPSAQADALAALDRHLSSYLIPEPAVGPLAKATADA